MGRNESAPLSPTERTRLRRYPERARTDRDELYRVLDEGLICFLGTVVNGGPRVIPMIYGRVEDTLYLHGSVANQELGAARAGAEVCVTVADINGLVLANSLFHHSMQFQSAMIFGVCREVTDSGERLQALRATADQLVPGRSQALPEPTRAQHAQTMILALSLEEASVKVREGYPSGDPADYERDIWAGVLPLLKTWGDPIDDPKLRAPVSAPSHVTRLVGRRAAERRP